MSAPRVSADEVVLDVEGGPLLVRGDVVVHLADGTQVAARRPVVAVCRCERSRIAPWCDGTHRMPGGPGSAEAPGAGRAEPQRP